MRVASNDLLVLTTQVRTGMRASLIRVSNDASTTRYWRGDRSPMSPRRDSSPIAAHRGNAATRFPEVEGAAVRVHVFVVVAHCCLLSKASLLFIIDRCRTSELTLATLRK